jgi:hypothetical protein
VYGDAAGMMHAAARQIEPDTGALTQTGIREILAEVVSVRDDAQLSYLDGRQLFGHADVSHLYDDLHPDEAGLQLIAERFVDLIQR